MMTSINLWGRSPWEKCRLMAELTRKRRWVGFGMNLEWGSTGSAQRYDRGNDQYVYDKHGHIWLTFSLLLFQLRVGYINVAPQYDPGKVKRSSESV